MVDCWKSDDVKHWGKDKDATNFADIPQMRRICEKHGVEFVENREEWARYLRDHDMKVEVDPERIRPSDVTLQIPSTDKFKKQTGWEPEIKFEKTLRDTLDYWRNYFKTVKIYHEKK